MLKISGPSFVCSVSTETEPENAQIHLSGVQRFEFDLDEMPPSTTSPSRVGPQTKNVHTHTLIHACESASKSTIVVLFRAFQNRSYICTCEPSQSRLLILYGFSAWLRAVILDASDTINNIGVRAFASFQSTARRSSTENLHEKAAGTLYSRTI